MKRLVLPIGPAVQTDTQTCPAVARTAADLALDGRSDVVDPSGFGMDRFDEQGRSRTPPDPVALPFPVSAGKD